MTRFEYDPRKISEEYLLEKIKELVNNAPLRIGDTVMLKGDKNSPTMCVCDISVRTDNLLYNKISRITTVFTCKWFNKSKQSFSEEKFDFECLDKQEDSFSKTFKTNKTDESTEVKIVKREPVIITDPSYNENANQKSGFILTYD